jgi:hypothetical protein
MVVAKDPSGINTGVFWLRAARAPEILAAWASMAEHVPAASSIKDQAALGLWGPGPDILGFVPLRHFNSMPAERILTRYFWWCLCEDCTKWVWRPGDWIIHDAGEVPDCTVGKDGRWNTLACVVHHTLRLLFRTGLPRSFRSPKTVPLAVTASSV